MSYQWYRTIEIYSPYWIIREVIGNVSSSADNRLVSIFVLMSILHGHIRKHNALYFIETASFSSMDLQDCIIQNLSICHGGIISTISQFWNYIVIDCTSNQWQCDTEQSFDVLDEVSQPLTYPQMVLVRCMWWLIHPIRDASTSILQYYIGTPIQGTVPLAASMIQ